MSDQDYAIIEWNIEDLTSVTFRMSEAFHQAVKSGDILISIDGMCTDDQLGDDSIASRNAKMLAESVGGYYASYSLSEQSLTVFLGDLKTFGTINAEVEMKKSAERLLNPGAEPA